jgi:hypothetical protein
MKTVEGNIDGRKIYLPEQTFVNNERYVKVKDLIQYFEENQIRFQNDKCKVFPKGDNKGKVIHKEYKRGRIGLLKQVVQTMKDLEGYDTTPIGIPNRFIKDTLDN